MAKFTLEFDTVSKQAVMAMDGTPVDNVGDLCLFRTHYNNKAEYHLEFVQRTSDEENDTVTYTRTMAEDKALAAIGDAPEPADSVFRDIQRYFSGD